MSIKKFKKIESLRKPLSAEIGKIINKDRRIIELLRPMQTNTGTHLIFHIRSDSGNKSSIIQLIQNEANNGSLAKVKLKTHILYLDMALGRHSNLFFQPYL